MVNLCIESTPSSEHPNPIVCTQIRSSRVTGCSLTSNLPNACIAPPPATTDRGRRKRQTCRQRLIKQYSLLAEVDRKDEGAEMKRAHASFPNRWSSRRLRRGPDA